MKNRGYITLISTIIISIVLLSAVVSLGEKAILGRFILLDIERKIDSEKLAAACLQVAMAAIAGDPTYTVSTPVPVIIEAGRTCDIYSVSADSPGAGQSAIVATAEVDGATTIFSAVYDQAAEAIITWQELADLP